MHSAVGHVAVREEEWAVVIFSRVLYLVDRFGWHRARPLERIAVQFISMHSLCDNPTVHRTHNGLMDLWRDGELINLGAWYTQKLLAMYRELSEKSVSL